MDGVTIVNSFDIFEIAWWQFLLGLIPLFAACIFYGICENKKINHNFNRESIIPLCALILGGVISIILILGMAKVCPARYIETHHEIQIEDTVLFKDVYKDYIILEEKENTFIVKER